MNLEERNSKSTNSGPFVVAENAGPFVTTVAHCRSIMQCF